MGYKCPYCLHSFQKEDALVESSKNGVLFQHCPNPVIKEIGGKICGKRLPLNFFESESIIIALTGAKYVGKTYYYIALLDQLKNNQSLHQLGIQGDIVGSDEDKRKLNKFLDDVRNKKRLGATISIEDALKSVIHLTIVKNKKTKHVYLSLFDNPGEKFTDIDHMIDNFSNVYKADGLLFLVEPKQIKKFWIQLFKNSGYLLKEQQTDDLYSVLNNIIQLIKHVNNNQQRNDINSASLNSTSSLSNRWEEAKRRFIGLKNSGNNNKIKNPIAVSISKFDQLSKSIPITIPYDESQLETMCVKDNKLDEGILNGISNEIEDILTNLPDGDARIKNLLNGDVENYAFFGVRSIDVNEDGEPEMLNPQGVLLPLIWLLIKLKLY